jgi:hypothetical protein
MQGTKVLARGGRREMIFVSSRLLCLILVATLVLQIGCSYKSPVPLDMPASEIDDDAVK